MAYQNNYNYVRINSFSKMVADAYGMPNNNDFTSLIHASLYVISKRIFTPNELVYFKNGDRYNEKFLKIIWHTYGEQFRNIMRGQWLKRHGSNNGNTNSGTTVKESQLIRLIREAIENEMNVVSCAVYIFSNINGKPSVLAGRRSTSMGNWKQHSGGLYNVPVGMKERGESDAECAVREVMEETGLSLNPNSLKDAGIEVWGQGKTGRNFIVMCNGNTEVGNGDGENDRFIWLPLDEVDKVQWAFNMGKTVKEMANKI